MDTFPKSLNLLTSLASRWSITFRTARRGCCCDKAMMAPPLINNVCALFSPTVEETVPHPIYIVGDTSIIRWGRRKIRIERRVLECTHLFTTFVMKNMNLFIFPMGSPSVVSNQISLMSLYNSTCMSHMEGSLCGNIFSPIFLNSQFES